MSITIALSRAKAREHNINKNISFTVHVTSNLHVGGYIYMYGFEEYILIIKIMIEKREGTCSTVFIKTL